MDKQPIFVYLKENKQKTQKFEVGIVINQNKDELEVVFCNEILHLHRSDVEFFDYKKTGDLYDKKICNRCFRLLPIDEFQKNQNGKGDRTVRRPSCNDCRKEIDGVAVTSEIKKIWNQIKPNLQIWECPICHKKSIPGLTSKVVLDHDHKTGFPRKWICDSCNTGLGRFNDDIEILKNAIKYLESFENEKNRNK